MACFFLEKYSSEVMIIGKKLFKIMVVRFWSDMDCTFLSTLFIVYFISLGCVNGFNTVLKLDYFLESNNESPSN